MIKSISRCKIVMFVMFLMLLMPMKIMPNSAEPPALTILVKNPPEDLTITMVVDGQRTESRMLQTAWEGYFKFYRGHMNKSGTHTFEVSTGETKFVCSYERKKDRYSEVYTLDLENQRLFEGEYPFRAATLIGLRILLTLLIEGLIFWLFGFRQKRSWIIFLIVNLITQGLLNIWFQSELSFSQGYVIIALIVGEIFVFIAEMISMPRLIDERNKSYVMLYAFTANLISLILGGYIINLLPI